MTCSLRYGRRMRRNLGVLLAASSILGVVLFGPLGAASADAGTLLPVLRASHVGVVAPPATRNSPIAPLSHGWIGTITNSYNSFVQYPLIFNIDSGPTGAGGTTGANVLKASMTGARGAFTVQVSIPVGQTFQMNRLYNSGADSASVIAGFPGGGCASSGYGGNAFFTVNQLTRSGGGATTAYAVQFLCSSSTGLVEGAFANNVVPVTPNQGYYTFGMDGSISGFGNDSYLSYLGNLAGTPLKAPIVAMAITPSGAGYWLVGADGGVFSYGDARFFGSMGAATLNQPITGMAATADGLGYWIVAADGGIFAFGDAGFKGSMGGKPLNRPIVGMTAALGGGYRLVATDGGIFAFGSAAFYGSMGGKKLNQPIGGMTATPSGLGYWMVASDGGIFAFGDAAFFGSMGAIPLNANIVGMNSTSDGNGYWLVGADGGVFAFGNAPFYGSTGGLGYSNVAGIAT